MLICFKLVDRAGFEPAASALRTRRSYRTDLPALFWKNTVIRAFRAFGEFDLSLFGFNQKMIRQISKHKKNQLKRGNGIKGSLELPYKE